MFHCWSSTICTVRLFLLIKLRFSLATIYRTVYSLQRAGFTLFAAFIHVYCVHDWERAWHYQIYLQILCARNAHSGRLHSFVLNHRLPANFGWVVAADVHWSCLLVYESTKPSQEVSLNWAIVIDACIVCAACRSSSSRITTPLLSCLSFLWWWVPDSPCS